jgi:hypothetical protein
MVLMDMDFPADHLWSEKGGEKEGKGNITFQER